MHAKFLTAGLVDPSGSSVKSIGIAMGLPFPLSMKDMLKHGVISKVIRYGIYLCTYKDATRATILDDGWLDRVFSDPLGVASYFRKMSLWSTNSRMAGVSIQRSHNDSC